MITFSIVFIIIACSVIFSLHKLNILRDLPPTIFVIVVIFGFSICIIAKTEVLSHAIKTQTHMQSCGSILDIKPVQQSDYKRSFSTIHLQTKKKIIDFQVEDVPFEKGDNLCIEWMHFEYLNHPKYIINIIKE